MSTSEVSQNQPSSSPESASKVVLVSRQLIVRVGGHTLIGPFDLEIRSGERIGFLGPSGSGKSLLLDRLMGLTPLRSGEGRVAIRRRSPSETPSPSPRYPVAAVFQTNALFDTLTVRENVAVGGKRAPRSTEVDDALRSVRLDPESDGGKFPSELSGGMQRRVAVARALVASPQVLVLDEPLVGLDGETRSIVMDTVRRAHRDHGMTCLVVTHDYDFAVSFCDRMFWIDSDRHQLVEIEEWPSMEESKRLDRIRDLLGKKEVTGETDRTGRKPRLRISRPSPGLFRSFSDSILESAGFLQDTMRQLPSLAASLFRGPFSGIRPGRDFLEFWIRSCILAVPYIVLLFALVGFLIVLQSERLLAPLSLQSQIPEAVTRGIVQGMGPLLLVLLMAGRTGSAMAADLGGQRLSRQVEMWSLLGRHPHEVLFAPRCWALILAFPILTLLAEFIALGAGWLFFSLAPHAGLTPRAYWEGVKAAWELGPTLEGMLRTALDGCILGGIAYLFGTAPKRAAEDIAEAATRTVVVASIAFLAVEVVWTALF